MSLLALAVTVGSGITAACLTAWLLRRPPRTDLRAAVEHPRRVGARYVDLPGFPHADTQASDLAPDNDTGPDLRYAVYPPGSLGEHPEQLPGPGVLAADTEDVTDLLTGVLRYVREAATEREAS